MICKTCGHKWEAEVGVVCPSCGSRYVGRRVSWAAALLLAALFILLIQLFNSALW